MKVEAVGSLPKNRLVTNRLPTNRLRLNRLPTNRLPANRSPTNRLRLNRLPTNCLRLNRLGSNRLQWHELRSNHLRSNHSACVSLSATVDELYRFFELGRCSSGTAPSCLCPCIEKVRHCEDHLTTNWAKLTFKSPAWSREVSRDRPREVISKHATLPAILRAAMSIIDTCTCW